MKNLYKNQIVLLALLLFCLGIMIPFKEVKAENYNPFRPTQQPKEEKQKVVKATFKVNPKDLVNISNKYGNVNFVNHDKNEVSVQVTILAWARSDKEAQKILDRITIDQEQTGEGVSFETQIEESRGGHFSNKEGFEINYEIKIPKNLNLDVENQFGSVVVADLNGKLNLDLKHGDFHGHNLT